MVVHARWMNHLVVNGLIPPRFALYVYTNNSTQYVRTYNTC